MRDAAIFIVDSDLDDQELILEAWEELKYPNKLLFFKSAEEALHHIETKAEVPFLVISELVLPKMTGLQMKQQLMDHKHSYYKTIPFVFLSASVSERQVREAYDLCVNGVFEKHSSFQHLKDQLVRIARYWAESRVPAIVEDSSATS